MASNESGSGFATGPDSSFWSGHPGGQDPVSLNQTERSKIHQDQIQAACLLTIRLTESARQPLTPSDVVFLEKNLNELIQCQQDLENELGRLHGTQDLTHLWWQAAELETLIYGFHRVLAESRAQLPQGTAPAPEDDPDTQVQEA